MTTLLKDVSNANDGGSGGRQAARRRDRYYIVGVHHGPAKHKNDIHPDEADYEIYRERMDELNRKMVGMPITATHPKSGDTYVPSEQWKSNVRGRCVHTGKLDDGSYFFIGEMPLKRGMPKLWFTKYALENGELNSVSLGNTFEIKKNAENGEWDANYDGDHIALVPTGTEYRKGCSVLYVSPNSMPIELFQQDEAKRDEALKNMAAEISQKNSDANPEVNAGSPPPANTAAESDTDCTDDTETVSSGMATAQGQQQGNDSANTAYIAQQTGDAAPFNARMPTDAQPATDDAQQQQQQQSQQQSQSGEYLTAEDAKNYNNEQLVNVINKLFNDINSVSQENVKLKQTELKKKVDQLEDHKKQLTQRIAYGYLQSIDGEPTEENKKEALKKAEDRVKTLYPYSTRQLMSMDPEKAEKKMNKSSTYLNTMNDIVQGFAVASREAYEDRKRAREIIAQNRGRELQHRIHSRGVRAQPMKRQRGAGVQNKSVSWADSAPPYGGVGGGSSGGNLYQPQGAGMSSSSSSSAASVDSILPTGDGNGQAQQTPRNNFSMPTMQSMTPTMVKQYMEKAKQYNAAQKYAAQMQRSPF